MGARAKSGLIDVYKLMRVFSVNERLKVNVTTWRAEIYSYKCCL